MKKVIYGGIALSMLFTSCQKEKISSDLISDSSSTAELESSNSTENERAGIM